jgi:hypothetical protein
MKNVAASVRVRLGKQSKAEGQTLDILFLVIADIVRSHRDLFTD